MRRRPRRTRRTERAAAPAGLVGPGKLEVSARHLRVGDGTVTRTLAVTGYPREVRPGWLEPLLNDAGAADVAMHVEPIAPQVAAQHLKRQLARLESTRRLDAARGRLADPDVEVAAEDARDLADRLARGEGRLFRLGLYLTVRAADEDELDRETSRLRGILASLLVDAQPATFRHLHGWLTTLPLGIDALAMRRTFDTAALAASFPFASADLSEPGGVLYGVNASSRGLVFWDRFGGHDNQNAVILARSGAGKSYLTKLEALRSLYRGVEVAVIDPEDEYGRLAEAVGGRVIRLGAPDVSLNPFDLGGEDDAVTARALFVHTLVELLMREPLDPASKASLDRAILAAYRKAGITHDPDTHARSAPLLADLRQALAADTDAAAQALAARLAPFTEGSHRHLFERPTTTRPEGHLVVFSLRDLAEETQAAGTLLALDALWRQVSDPAARRRRLVVVDEAWLLMAQAAGARFLYRLAKSARKYWCGLTVVTQDAADLLGSDLGQAVVANAATQVLMRQAPQAIDALAAAFKLSDGERQFLLAADRGEGILVGAAERVAFRAVASPAEDRLCTSDPAELAEEDA